MQVVGEPVKWTEWVFLWACNIYFFVYLNTGTAQWCRTNTLTLLRFRFGLFYYFVMLACNQGEHKGTIK